MKRQKLFYEMRCKTHGAINPIVMNNVCLCPKCMGVAIKKFVKVV